MMRVLILLAAFAAAAPAAAQDWSALTYARDGERAAAQQAARQRDIAITNELSRLQTQAQTTQTLSDLAAARVTPTVPTVPFNAKAPPPKLDASKLAQIPDAVLADSNAKVLAASENRR